MITHTVRTGAYGVDQPPVTDCSAEIPMECRPACAACCTAPSISSPIPGMPTGKPAGVVCVQLDSERRCRLFGRPERPAVCSSLRPSADMCGDNPEAAMVWLLELELQTMPAH